MAFGSFACSKMALCVLNVIYILVACIMISVAAYGKVVAIIETITVMSGLVACGVLLLIISIIGLIGAIRHHQVLLFFYMIILFVLFLVQFTLACACLALSADQQRRVLRVGWSRASDELKLQMQAHFSCCGFDNETANIPTGTPDPMGHPPCVDTCCDRVKRDAGDISNNSTNMTMTTVAPPPKCRCPPCLSRAEAHLDAMVKTVGALGLVFSFTELFGVWLTIKYRNLKDPHANPGAFL